MSFPRSVPRLLVLLVALAGIGGAAVADGELVQVYRLEGMIYGVPAVLLERALDQAAEQQAALFLIEIDTPGGDAGAMERMVKAIVNSKVPVCVYVTPSGAHAASAGFFLLIAADIAAMAPLTRTGAASPIYATGQGSENDVVLKKLQQDMSALIRSAARARGRPAELAERAVTDALSWSAEEAREAGLVDFVIGTRRELVAALNGHEVIRGDGTRQTLRIENPRVVEYEFDWVDNLKSVLFHPAMMLVALALAVIGIYTELTHPGLILPGVVGVVCLLFVLYGSQVLPINLFAVALIVVGLVMFILEIKVVSYGMLSLGGAVCLGLGMYLLFPRDIPGLAIPIGAMLPIVAFTILCVGGATYLVIRTMRRPVTTGREGVIGLIGTATTDLDPQGTVFVRGEYWSAEAPGPVRAGDRVRVLAADGLLLSVEPAARAAEVTARGPVSPAV